MNKWSGAYFQDLIERVVATGIAALLALITADSTGVVVGSGEQYLTLIGIPMLVSLLKGLLVNLPDTALPSASLVGVSSTKTTKANPGEAGRIEGSVIWLLAVVGVVLLVLVLVGVLR